MDHSPERDQLVFSEDFLFDLINTHPLSSIKDAQTKKYIQMNYLWAENLGFDSTEELIGLTVDDITYKEQSRIWGAKDIFIHLRDEQQKKIKRLDDQTKISKECVNFDHILFDSEGFLILEETRKIPIISFKTEKVVAIFTYGQNTTLQLSLFNLLDLYKKYYPETQAIKQLLRYLRLDKYFTETPTLTEMRLLITMRQDPRHKCAAKALGLAVGTVEVYAHKLRDKLTTDLNNVLAGLRTIPHV